MRRHLVVAGSCTLLLANATGVAAAGDDHHGHRDPVVVAAGLDNPRQLNWLGHKLLVAEGGNGGDNCLVKGICGGSSGQISAVTHPFHARHASVSTLVDGLFSVATPEGVVGSDGAAATGFRDVLLIAEGEPLPDRLGPPGFETKDPHAETQEHLLISVNGEVFPWVDFGAWEKKLNPDKKKALDSNPNAVIVVDPTPKGKPGRDEYALVADAGANTVWKVDPDFAHTDKFGLPRKHVSVFAAFDASDPKAPEFVPSALDQDEDGNIYVGGVGSLIPGAASVVRYDADGHRTARWNGFTGINGLAVDHDGDEIYVSQIVGPDADFADPRSGDVVRIDTEDRTYASVDVPRPSGLALGKGHHRHHDTVFVSAYSTSNADGDPATKRDDSGQIWRFRFPKHADESPLPVTKPPAA
jgi:hypothetical protein